jgi:hypothetical protein
MIHVVDGAVPDQLCQAIIDRFHSESSWTVSEPGWMQHQGMYAKTDSLGIRRSYSWAEEVVQLTAIVYQHYLDYRSQWDPHGFLPLRDFDLEQFRCKQYLQAQDQFALHIDAGTQRNSSRFLAHLIYLNDSDAATVFPQQSVTVAARRGRLVQFPPYWGWPHQGQLPLQGNKYIVSCYYCWQKG